MFRHAGITIRGLVLATALVLLPVGATQSAEAAQTALSPAPQSARSAAATRDGTGIDLSSCFFNDNGDPQLLGLSVDQTRIDVRRRSRTLTFTATVVDHGGPGPASGVRSIHVRFAQRLGRTIAGVHLQYLAGNQWQGSIRVPRFIDSVADRVRFVRVADRAGNVHFMHWPVSFSVVSAPDSAAPTLTSIGFVRKAALSTRNGARRVTVTATATDTGGAGVASVTVGLVPRTGNPNLLSPVEAVLRPTSQDGLSGTARIPAWVGSATWELSYAGVVDRAGNDRQYDDDLAALGTHHELRVVSRHETTVPHVGAVRGIPPSLDVRSQRRSFTIKVGAGDGGSGVATVTAQLWQLDANGFETGQVGAVAALRRTSGSARQGGWTARVSVPRCSFAASGRVVLHLVVTDRARNVLLRTVVHKTDLTSRSRSLPGVVASSRVVPYGPPILTFNRAVRGISTRSAPVVQIKDDVPQVLRGSWRCRTVSGRVTSCLTGLVRTARFHPLQPVGAYDQASVQLNPAGRLNVRDLRGTPYDRTVLYYS